VAPSGQVYNSRSDLRLAVKQLTIPANINETGSWSYKIERINGNPQPHYVQVMATPRSDIASVIRARAWLKRTKDGGPFVLYAEVKKGYLPVSNALVEVTVSRPELQCNSSTECKEKFKLHDTGSGDPDIMRGDGIYTRYFDAASTGPGTYKFEFLVNDNGNTAYALAEHTFGEFNEFNFFEEKIMIFFLLQAPTKCKHKSGVVAVSYRHPANSRCLRSNAFCQPLPFSSPKTRLLWVLPMNGAMVGLAICAPNSWTTPKCD
jgi:hypothetical protein